MFYVLALTRASTWYTKKKFLTHPIHCRQDSNPCFLQVHHHIITICFAVTSDDTRKNLLELVANLFFVAQDDPALGSIPVFLDYSCHSFPCTAGRGNAHKHCDSNDGSSLRTDPDNTLPMQPRQLISAWNPPRCNIRAHRLWNQVTDNYGNVMPVDWRSSHARSLYLPALNLNEHKEKESLTLDLPDDDDDDDDELREQLDMHSIIVSCVQPQEPLFTAEQVIEEIEEMMQESPDAEEDGVGESGLSGTTSSGQGDRISITSPDTSTSDGYSMDAGLRGLSVAQLMEHLEALESTIRSFSEELIQELALRDELEFEKEVKNTFIASLIEVQNKQKEFRELAKRKRRSTGTSPNHWRERGAITVGRTIAPGTYLTTIIPYEEKDEPPSVEQLQVLIKILKAMKDDSEKVPGLLTDYILKVLCPT
uniref:fasciculation and elongation protein zeta-2-like isoform X1 n=1 Tax=Myxine glutinosa TaxID=7769 RepID=UPI00358DEF9D